MVLRFGLMVALVAGLAAIQLVPFLHLAANSQREQGFADTRWSLPAWGWVNYLVPLVFGRVWNMGVFFQHEQSWTSSYYLGMGPLLLALAGAGWNRDRRSRVLLVACVAAFALALGDQLILNRWLRAVLPQLSLVTYPVKFVTVIAFAAPLLAAGAYACLGRPSNGTPDGKLAGKLFGLALILGLLIGAILAWARQSPFPTDNLSLTLKSSLTRAGFLAIAAAILLLKVRLARRPWPVLLPLVLIAVFWLDVWTHAPNQNPSVPPWVYQAGLARTKLELQPPPALGASRAMVSPVAELQFTTFTVSNPRDNYLAKRMGLFADCNVLDGIPKVNGFFSLYPRASGELVSTLYGSTNAGYPRICDFMAVSHSTSSGAAYEWLRRTNWLPLITAGQVPVFLDSTNQLRAVLSRDFDFQSRVVLPLDAQSVLKITNPATAKVLASRFRNQAVDFEVETSAQTLCVVAQTWFPHWRAWVDGQPVKLWRANFAFQALEIPPGRHKVRLAYRDTGFAIGAAISAVTLAICALSWWRLRRNRQAPLSP